MKTYKSELTELKDWFMKVSIENMEAQFKDTTPGKDGKLVYERRQDVLEYNRRLTELKLKYKKDTPAKKTALSEQAKIVRI